MEANELMIGDWVCYSEPNNYYTKVKEIRCTSDGEEYYIRCHRDSKDTFLEQLKYEDFSVDILHPILLTPEILEKNGFSDNYAYDNLSYAVDFVGDIIGVHIVGKGGVMDEMYFKYVHELQHALRLCGIEKDIVL